ncbi:UDP-glucose/GDP-mannose dehydrogenase family protein [Thermosulfurimonas sp. F29]|uniref:UDP-glucose dehydrogenase family protein n=1 Tax=Thermosulfurimonas sp. F29 TaxID=2867247 RepID=UPI001C836B17|nr:UDP-glucose/GDP-mannose dehydrogenase family protein [Thermosulfurimonas sp. F29]MBX6423925.1 UDP-glucose/GDP-mannose dehydrogenase family protein [Thermosulfurimonas sp. F29]
MHIAVIGTGYVGLVSGAGMADFGMKVICVDKDRDKIKQLEKGRIPFYEPGLEELVHRNKEAGRLSFTTDLRKAVRQALAVFICVGTPPAPDGSADLSQIREVALALAEALDDYKVVVTKSTVPVGTNRWIKSLIDKHKKNNVAVDIISNPEFLREGSAVEDFMHPDRVVIGGESAYAIAIVKDIYRPLYLAETPFIITDLETAEMIKYASNAFLATKVSFINEIANLCEKVGADVTVVARAMGFDPRIGRKFLNPGPGFGGSCFPKDVKALVHQGREAGSPMRILEAVLEVNERQKRRAVEKAEALCGDLSGKTVAVLGLSFKPNTSDVRESPALTVVPELVKRGARVRVYDPVAMEEFQRWLPELRVDYVKNPLEAARGAHALIILTEWNEFRFLDLQEIKKIMAEPNLVDMRNIYEPETVKALGFRYTGVGRS